MMGTYIRFASERNYQFIRFSNHLFDHNDVVEYLRNHKNILTGEGCDNLELIDEATNQVSKNPFLTI